MLTRSVIAFAATLALAASACSHEPKDDRPAGPESIAVPAVAYSKDAADIEKGEDLFKQKGCAACHKIGGGKLVGPDLRGVTARRNPKWIARMILKPEGMVKEDETAKELLKTHMTPMSNQNVDPATELPALLAYLHANES
jgi:mono/diheme cytochrome c family protein